MGKSFRVNRLDSIMTFKQKSPNKRWVVWAVRRLALKRRGLDRRENIPMKGQNGGKFYLLNSPFTVFSTTVGELL